MMVIERLLMRYLLMKVREGVTGG